MAMWCANTALTHDLRVALLLQPLGFAIGALGPARVPRVDRGPRLPQPLQVDVPVALHYSRLTHAVGGPHAARLARLRRGRAGIRIITTSGIHGSLSAGGVRAAHHALRREALERVGAVVSVGQAWVKGVEREGKF